MLAGIAQHPEMGGVAGGFEHGGGVAADEHGAASFEGMVVVEHELGGLARDGAQVGGHLAVVFALVFEVELEGAHGERVEADVADFGLNFGVIDGEAAARKLAVVVHAQAQQQAPKILGVHGPAQALAVEDGVLTQVFGHATVGKYVGDEQLAAGLQHPENLAVGGLLVSTQVEYAVAHHQVHAVVGQAGGGQVFNVAVAELDVGLGIAELLGVEANVAAGHVELLFGHVHADDVAGFAHQLRQQIGVAAAAAAQIEHREALDGFGHAHAAAVVFIEHLGGQLRENAAVGQRNIVGAAGVGEQVLAGLQLGAIVILNLGVSI